MSNHGTCFNCSDWKCRCSDCPCLVERSNAWYCDEYDGYCREIEECGEYFPETGCGE